MTRFGGIRLAPSAALKEKRLVVLLEGKDPADPRLVQAVEDAQILGSLELAELPATLDDLAAARRGEPAPDHVLGLLRALRAVDPRAPFGTDALLAWHAAATGRPGGFRARERQRTDAPPPAPVEFIAGRLAILDQWLSVESSRELTPFQAGALLLARIVEILPFEDANGRVSRLAASHMIVRAGGRPPILRGNDAPRLKATLEAAFQLVTEPLGTLLAEASERSVDVMIAALAGGDPA